mgnify:CR=1 FL=1
MRIASLHRYPVKGFSPEAMGRAVLEKDGFWPGDRMFAVENGPSGFDAAQPTHDPKIKYLMLMRNESLARLVTRFDDDTQMLTITHEGLEVARGDVRTAEGRGTLEAFLAGYCSDELRGPPRLLSAPAGHRFMDSRSGFVSLINHASIAALATHMGAVINPLRFRGNIYVEELEAHAELEWAEGTRLEAGRGVVLEVIKRIERCAATNVDPVTGMRDLHIPKALMKSRGHVDCGVYLRIVAGGVLSAGEHLSVAASAVANAGFPLLPLSGGDG